jgi:epoxyqueuosine reductase
MARSAARVTMTDEHQLAAEIKRKAREIGFDLCGITDAGPSRRRAYFEAWLAAGRAGEMHYLHERVEERTDPTKLLPGAERAICVAMNDHVPLAEPPAGEDRVRVARYALGVDYHTHLKDKLYSLADWLRERVPTAQTKCAVDTVPVLERELAARAGIGWVGKNTCVINPKIGRWIFLGEVFTTLELPIDAPGVDRCGTCRRCIDACPTNAIVAPYELDASRCISYLTIEHHGPIDPALAAQAKGWAFGCDICQDVCPWNGRAPVALLDELQPRLPDGTFATDDILEWDDERYWAATRRSAMRRVKLPQFKRNARLARGEPLGPSDRVPDSGQHPAM